MRKLVKVFFVAVLCCAFLTGCMGVIADIRINEDGSGIVTASVGYTAEVIEMLESMGGSEEDFQMTDTFEYNGIRYYGAVDSREFANLEEYNLIEAEDEGLDGVDDGEVELTQNEDGSFNLKFTVTPETGSTEQFEESIEGEDVDAEALLEGMAIVLIYDFPHKVEQVSGSDAGVKIDGTMLTIDAIKMAEGVAKGGEATYEFRTIVGDDGIVVDEEGKMTFFDVEAGAWYHDAIYALANAGTVKGVSDGRFAPNDTLTYAQFCQILAGERGLETGAGNGYWAYKAIESCLKNGYIEDRGEFTPENYNVPILREAAVAAMYKATALGNAQLEISDADIPDYSEINEGYKADILGAYNVGITRGIDENGTFNPKGQLNRAEVCQLFYNIR